MKQIIAATVLAVASFTAQAQLTYEACKSLGDTARAVMQSRQVGVPLSTTLGNIPADAPPTVRQLLQTIVMQAYEEPRYQSAEMQVRATQDFRNRLEGTCFKNAR